MKVEFHFFSKPFIHKNNINITVLSFSDQKLVNSEASNRATDRYIISKLFLPLFKN